MVHWQKLFGLESQDLHGLREEARNLLPITATTYQPPAALPPLAVTKVALRVRYLIEQTIPCELPPSSITKANSPVLTPRIIALAKNAGQEEPTHNACVIFCLLIVHRWFQRQALQELWDADLHNVRATACEVLAKHIIEGEEDQGYLLQGLLLKRYSILINDQPTEPANAVERAVDLHALRVIGSAGFLKCIQYLWRGWMVQDDQSPSNFVPWGDKVNEEYWAHFDPDRMRAPRYQNAVQIFFSLLYLVLYTVAINTINSTGDLDLVEGVLYGMTAGFLFDEISKIWKVGRHYIGFWNVFNSTLLDSRFNKLSYNFLAFSAPMFWMRMLLYLDTLRFFGAMLVVLKVMMKESLIFFALLVIVMVGFLQAFIGMDTIDDDTQVKGFIVQALINAVMQSPDFAGFENFAPPFGIVLYYIFTFVVMVVLLNILIALYNSAYEDITDNAIDEYMALFSLKTLQFVRAPDENVFIAPFNLIEIFCLILPFEWWLPASRYERLNNYVMGILCSPLLLLTAYLETKQAHTVRKNRRHGESDEDTIQEWERIAGEVDFEGDGWAKKVGSTRPNVETDAAVLEIRELKGQMEELRKMVEALGGKGENGST